MSIPGNPSKPALVPATLSPELGDGAILGATVRSCGAHRTRSAARSPTPPAK